MSRSAIESLISSQVRGGTTQIGAHPRAAARNAQCAQANRCSRPDLLQKSEGGRGFDLLIRPNQAQGVERRIVGFHQDEAGDWVAELSCLHNQHVRHRPPFLVRPWVLTDDGRTSHVGSRLDCPLCERAEAPDGLKVSRTAGPFDESTLPQALLRDHVVGEGTWGSLRVLDGQLAFTAATHPPIERSLGQGDVQSIPPGVRHHLTLSGSVEFVIDFLVGP
jgi:tellurite resistance-related uncharacterized protein